MRDGGTTLVAASPLLYEHLGEVRPLAGGLSVAFRAHVGLLSRNVVFQGRTPFSQLDHHGAHTMIHALPPSPYHTAAEAFPWRIVGAHIMMHSKGHESLVGRIEDIEVRYAGQGFRLGRYPVHFHMIGTGD